MAELMCLDCLNTFDPLIGHYCVNKLWISGYANRNIAEQAKATEKDILEQGSTTQQRAQINEVLIGKTEPVNSKTKFSHAPYSSHQRTFRNDGPTCANQNLETVEASSYFMAINSEHGHIEEQAIGGLNNQLPGLNLGSNACNDSIGHSFANCEIASKNNLDTKMVCHLGLAEENLSIPSIPNTSQEFNDFAMLSGTSGIPFYEFSNLKSFEAAQLELVNQNNSSEFISNVIEQSHNYEITSVSDYVPFINEDPFQIHPQFKMRNKPDGEMAVININLSDVNHQFSKYKQDKKYLIKRDLESRTSKFSAEEPVSILHLLHCKNPTNVSREHARSKIDHVNNSSKSNLVEESHDYEMSEMSNVAPDKTEDPGQKDPQTLIRNVVTNEITIDNIPMTKMHHQYAQYKQKSKEVQLKDEFHKMTSNLKAMKFPRGQEETAIIENPWSKNSDIIDDCTKNHISALPSSSFSHCDERINFVYLRGLESKTNVKMNSAVHTDVKQFNCNICQKVFKKKGALNQHMLVHKEVKPFTCDICRKSFKRKIVLKTHVLRHRHEKPFNCEVCGKRFTEKCKLKRHRFTVHTGEKHYKCEVCGRSFARLDHLKRHFFTHTGDKPYSCEVCGKSFAESYYLKIHFFTHTDGKQHECMICRKKFSEKSSLNRHFKNIHKPK